MLWTPGNLVLTLFQYDTLIPPPPSFVQFYNTNDAHYVDFVADTFDKIDNAATVAATSNIVSGCVGSTNICTGSVRCHHEVPVLIRRFST